MNKISSKEQDKLNKLKAEFQKKRAAAETALIEMAGAGHEAKAFIEDLASSAREYYDGRSEKWQEGDKGVAYDEWVSKLEECADAYDHSGDDEAEDLEYSRIKEDFETMTEDIPLAPEA
jgi:hypothetical protein